MTYSILKVLEGKYVQCTITPCYSKSPGVQKPTFFFFYLSLAVVTSCLKECLSHWSFVLVSRQMLPNSRTGTGSISKFPPYNLKKGKNKKKIIKINILIAFSTKRFVVFKGGSMRGAKRNVKTRDKITP